MIPTTNPDPGQPNECRFMQGQMHVGQEKIENDWHIGRGK